MARFTQKKKEVFLETLEKTANIKLSCEAIGVSRTAVYKARKRSKQFATDWDQALDNAIDMLEAEAHRRAFAGVDKPVTYKGEITAHYKEYSDVLVMFLLKAHRPEKYRERHEMTGKGGGPVEVVIDKKAAGVL